jgi:ATP-dependent helicase HepA
MVSGAMDMVLSGEFGNTAFCTVKLPPLKPGTILLEALYVLSCIAPGELQLHRFLPLTTLRLVIDHRNNDLTDILGSARLGKLAQEAPLHNARDLVRQTRPRITAMLEHAGNLAEARKSGMVDAAVTSMRELHQVEWERLQALAEVNPNIRQGELDHARGAADCLEPYLRGAHMRLDALRVVMVTG